MFEKKRGYKYSVWEHHPDTFLVTSEPMLMQKVNYIHFNPVKAGMVEHPDDHFIRVREFGIRDLERMSL